MRLIVALLVLVGTVYGADERTAPAAKYRLTGIEVVGSKAVTPEQISRDLAWNPDLIRKTYETDDPAVIAKRIETLVGDKYREWGFLDARVHATPTPGKSFRVEINEGPPYRRGNVEVVGAKQVDVQRLTHWLQYELPGEPADFVLEQDAKDKPSLIRRRTGALESRKHKALDSVKIDPGEAKKNKKNDGPRQFVERSGFEMPDSKALGTDEVSEAKSMLDPQGQSGSNPLWAPGAEYPNVAKAVEELDKWLRIELSLEGFHFAKFRVEFAPEPSSATVTLRIILEEEGLATRLGAVELRGNRRNSQELILSYLGLKIGERIDSARVAELTKRLTDSGRFLVHHLTLAPPASDGLATLYFDLREAPGVPLLSEDLSENQKLLLSTALTINRWKELGKDLVFDWKGTAGEPLLSADEEPTGATPPLSQKFNARVVASADGMMVVVDVPDRDHGTARTAAVVRDGELAFWNSRRQLRGKVDSPLTFQPALHWESGPVNAHGSRYFVRGFTRLRSRGIGVSTLDFSVDPATFMAALPSVRELENDLVEFTATDWFDGEGTVKVVVHRPSGRPHYIRLVDTKGTLEVAFKANALHDLRRQVEQKGASFRELSGNSQTLLQIADTLLKDVLIPCYGLPMLKPDQQVLVKSWLSRFDVLATCQQLNINLDGNRRSLFPGNAFQSLAMLGLNQAFQLSLEEKAPDVARLWLTAAQALSMVGSAHPASAESAAAEFLRFESTSSGFDISAQSPQRRIALSEDVLRRISTGKGFGPLIGLACVNSVQIRQLGLQKKLAAEALTANSKFSDEIGLLLAPDTSTRAVAMFLLEQLRALTWDDRELLVKVLDLSEPRATQLKLLWTALDTNQAMPSSELLPILLTTYWETSLRAAVLDSLENVILEGVGPEKHHLALLAKAKPHIEARNLPEMRFWLDRAEQRLESYVRSFESRPGHKERVEDVEIEGRMIICTLRGVLESRQGNYQASRDAYSAGIECAKKKLDSLGNGPNVDGFLGALTRRGKNVQWLVTNYSALSSAEWKFAGREPAIRAAVQAEQLAATLSEAADIESANVDLALPICHQSRYCSYADKDGSRDVERAMALAKKALQVGGEQHVDALDAYACALAAAGNFKEADTVIAKAAKYATGDNVPFIAIRQRHLTARRLPVMISSQQTLETVAGEEPAKAQP